MTKETKIGLLVGMGVIILIGILISDHLSVAQRQQQAELASGIPELDRDMIPPAPTDTGGSMSRGPVVASATTRRPIELPEDLVPPRQPEPQPPAVQHQPPQVLVQDVVPPVMERQPSRSIPSDPMPGARRVEVVEQSPPNYSGNAVIGYVSVPPPSTNLNTRPTQPVETKAIVHYVGKEETLSDISRKYYNTAGEWKAIYEANKGVLPNPNLLRPGVRLVIPPKPGMAVAAADTGATIRITAERPLTPAAAPAAPATKTYTVQEGDTFSSIAAKFTGSANNWQKLHAANKSRVKDPNRLAPGTVLQIPAH